MLHPPIPIDEFEPSPARAPYFLVLARLLPYKRIDVAVEAFNRLRWPLKIAGSGPDEARLRALAGPTVSFAGQIGDEERRHDLSHCQALIWPGEEDLGLAPLEALASGRPVVAFRAGGVLETLIEGVTGIFFPAQTPDALVEVLRRFDPDAYDPAVLRARAREFDVQTFRQRLRAFVDEAASH